MSQETSPDGSLMPRTVAGRRREDSFSAAAEVFILENRLWKEESQGLIEFVFDLDTYSLRLITSPGAVGEIDRRLRPRIRSKGPRAYVVRAQAPNPGDDDTILAVRFERIEDSLNFRHFAENRDVNNLNRQGKNVDVPPDTVAPINIVITLKNVLVVSLVINKNGIENNNNNNEKVLNFLSEKLNFSILTKLSYNDTYYNFSPMTNTLKKKNNMSDYKKEWTWKEVFDFGVETKKYLINGKHDGLIFLVSCNACPNDNNNNNDDSSNINSRDNDIDFGVLDSKSKVICCNNFLRQFSPQSDIPGIFIMDLKLSKENSGIEENCISSMNDNWNRCILRTQFLKDTDEKENLMSKVNQALEQAWNSNQSSLEWSNVEAFFDRGETIVVCDIDFVHRMVFELECMVITNLSQDTTIYVAIKNVINKKNDDNDDKNDEKQNFVTIKPKCSHNIVRKTTPPIIWITLYALDEKSQKNEILVDKKFRENYLYYKDDKLNSVLDLKPQCQAIKLHGKLSKTNFDLKRIRLNQISVKYQKYRCSGGCVRNKKGGYYYYCQHCKRVCYCEQCYHKNVLMLGKKMNVNTGNS